MGSTSGSPSRRTVQQVVSSQKIALAASAAWLFSLVLQVNVSQAATFTVNSTVDAADAAPGNGVCATAAGVCTLRAAIQETNALAGADTINLPAGVYVLTIPGANENAAATGDLDLTGDVTITGAGATTTLIDGNGSITGDRVFEINSASPLVTARISSVTIRGGTAPSAQNGGGIRSSGVLTLTDVVVTQNTAGVSGDTNNANGGGVLSNGVGATLSIVNSVITNNVAFRNGGGLRNGSAGTITVTNTTVSGNTGGNGGGFENAGVGTVINSTFTRNTATSGGGLGNSGTATLSGSTVSGNTGTNGPGGLLNESTGTLTLNTTTVSGNTGTNGPGGISSSSGSLTLNASTVSGNHATGMSGHGGGLNAGGTVNINDTQIKQNTASQSAGGGGLSGTVTINRSAVTLNTAQTVGGGISGAGTWTVNDSVIEGNSAQFGGGGMLVAGTVAVNRSTIRENTVASGSGGAGIGTGLRVEPGGTVVGATLTVDQSTLSGNTVTGSGGGGAISNFAGALRLLNSTLSGNSAPVGGGLSNNGTGALPGSATIANTTFASNTGTTTGGGISNGGGNTVTLLNTIVANSPSGNNCAGAITSSGNNLSSDASCAFAGAGDLNNTNPNLGPLGNNGGPTQTHALLAGSPAIDAGNNVGCPGTDQRGVVRPLDGNGDGSAICDIGAYELLPAFSLGLNGRTAYAETPHAPDLNLTGDWTIETWFKDDDPNGFNHDYKHLVNKGDREANPESPYFLAIGFKTLIVGERTSWTDHNVRYDLRTNGVDSRLWHHVAASFQASTRIVTVYLDGVLVTQGQLAARSAGNTLPVEIGRNGAVSGKYWTGKIDDLRLWNVVRTASDINARFRTELTGPQPGLVANWKFNEGRGPTTGDSAGGHTATLNGGAHFATDTPPPGPN